MNNNAAEISAPRKEKKRLFRERSDVVVRLSPKPNIIIRVAVMDDHHVFCFRKLINVQLFVLIMFRWVIFAEFVPAKNTPAEKKVLFKSLAATERK